jgi:hypothetical protein
LLSRPGARVRLGGFLSRRTQPAPAAQRRPGGRVRQERARPIPIKKERSGLAELPSKHARTAGLSAPSEAGQKFGRASAWPLSGKQTTGKDRASPSPRTAEACAMPPELIIVAKRAD